MFDLIFNLLLMVVIVKVAFLIAPAIATVVVIGSVLLFTTLWIFGD